MLDSMPIAINFETETFQLLNYEPRQFIYLTLKTMFSCLQSIGILSNSFFPKLTVVTNRDISIDSAEDPITYLGLIFDHLMPKGCVGRPFLHSASTKR